MRFLSAKPDSFYAFALSTFAVFGLLISGGCVERQYQPAKWRAAPRANSSNDNAGSNEQPVNNVNFPEVTDWTSIGGPTGGGFSGRGSSLSMRGSSLSTRGSSLSMRGSSLPYRGSRRGSTLDSRQYQRGSNLPQRGSTLDGRNFKRGYTPRGSSMPNRRLGSTLSNRSLRSINLESDPRLETERLNKFSKASLRTTKPAIPIENSNALETRDPSPDNPLRSSRNTP